MDKIDKAGGAPALLSLTVVVLLCSVRHFKFSHLDVPIVVDCAVGL